MAGKAGVGAGSPQPVPPGPARQISAPKEAKTGFDLVHRPGADPLCSCDRGEVWRIFEFIKREVALIDAVYPDLILCFQTLSSD